MGFYGALESSFGATKWPGLRCSALRSVKGVAPQGSTCPKLKNPPAFPGEPEVKIKSNPVQGFRAMQRMWKQGKKLSLTFALG